VAGFTPETGGSVWVADAAGVERFRAGSPIVGDDFAAVVNAPDDTLIIDGVSDVFRIQASGTISKVVANGDIDVTATVTIVGDFDAVPMILASIATAAAPTNRREFGSYGGFNGNGYVSSTSVGFTAVESMAATDRSAVIRAYLAGAAPNDLVIELGASAPGATLGFTASAKFYVLEQVGI
jgi:uncharacterized iron-regulated protein